MGQMYRLLDVEYNDEIGTITADQLQFLIDNLEEEGIEDQDYYIGLDALSFLAENGCDEELITMLTEALENKVNINLRYEAIE